MNSDPRLARENFEAQLKPVLAFAFRYAVRLTGNHEDGLDLVQDASVAAFRAFDQFETGTNFRAWFLRILTNRHFRIRKVASREPTERMQEAPDLWLYLQAK